MIIKCVIMVFGYSCNIMKQMVRLWPCLVRSCRLRSSCLWHWRHVSGWPSHRHSSQGPIHLTVTNYHPLQQISSVTLNHVINILPIDKYMVEHNLHFDLTFEQGSQVFAWTETKFPYFSLMEIKFHGSYSKFNVFVALNVLQNSSCRNNG